MHVAVLGGGSWGTTVAALVCRKANVQLWARNADTVAQINTQHTNTTYLPDAQLPDKLVASTDLGAVVRGADVVIMGIPSQYFRAVLNDIKPLLLPDTPVISLSKGLEADTLLRMTEIIAQVLPEHPAGVMTGPNLAREVMAGKAAASVIAMADASRIPPLQAAIGSGLFRVYSNTDVIGCELGGVLKNIIAIAVGMGDGRGAGDNTRAALITRGLAEVTRLGVAMGGKPETFAGLAGMGDMIATCTSPQSRNHHVGVELGKGRKPADVLGEMVMVAEGARSAPAVMALAEQYGVEMPIAAEVHRVLSGKSNASKAFRGLLRVVAGAESEPG
ncbi:MAG: NAD(P)H-dependent glycerol-3-phosphate dehydrogenase [Gammaproteobacteria bacterium]|nr:NAD(P)H-dependent glycerol-3-phosphate dehydrogenase [Gammaproteobacteria bacterium]